MTGVAKLEKVLRFAYNNVPFYNSILNSSEYNCKELYERTPVVSKDDIRENIMEFVARGQNIDDLETLTTSGSTGRPFKLYKSEKEILQSNLPLWRIRINDYGIMPSDRVCNFYIRHHDREDTPTHFIHKQSLFLSTIKLNKKNINTYINALNAFKPKWISASPNVLFLFVLLANKWSGKFEFIKYIELSGEFLSQYVKEELGKFFTNAKIVNQYGTRETSAIAIERNCGHMHILTDNVYVEKNANGLCVTALNSYSMPFIKYQLEDKIEKKNVDCINGKEEIVINNARTADYLEIDGLYYSPTIFTDIIGRINDKTILVKQFQIIQISPKKIIVKIVPLRDDNKLKEKIEQQFQQILKNLIDFEFMIDFEYSDVFDLSSTGKFYYFINTLSQSKEEKKKI